MKKICFFCFFVSTVTKKQKNKKKTSSLQTSKQPVTPVTPVTFLIYSFISLLFCYHICSYFIKLVKILKSDGLGDGLVKSDGLKCEFADFDIIFSSPKNTQRGFHNLLNCVFAPTVTKKQKKIHTSTQNPKNDFNPSLLHQPVTFRIYLGKMT